MSPLPSRLGTRVTRGQGTTNAVYLAFGLFCASALACATEEREPAPPDTPAAVSQSEPTEPQLVPPALPADTAIPAVREPGPITVVRDTVIEAAVVAAFALEESLFDRAGEIDSWDAVFDHVRQGFADSMARNLADYYWWTEGSALRMTESVLQVPDEVYVLSHGPSRASAWFRTPAAMEHSVFEPFTAVLLVREADGWVVAGARGSNSVPTAY